jgi:hypothetical protein
MNHWLTHWSLREAPFTKEIADGELWGAGGACCGD